MRRLLWLLAAVGLLAGGGFFLAGRSHDVVPQAAAPTATVPVVSVVVQETREARTLDLAGTVRPLRVVSIATRASGRITRITADEGDRVAAGQVLAQVDMATTEAQMGQAQAAVDLALSAVAQSRLAVARDDAARSSSQERLPVLEAQLQEARANAEQALLDRQRNAELYRQDAVPAANLDRATTDLRVARSRVEALQAAIVQARSDARQADAGLAEARADIERNQAAVEVARRGITVAASDLPYGTLTAPFGGTIVRRLAHVGDLASPGRALLELQDTEHLHLEVAVPEEEAVRHARVGTYLPVRLDSLELSLTGRVYELIPASDSSTHSVTIKVALPHHPDLMPGLYGRVLIRTGWRPLVQIPERSVVHRGELSGAYLLEHGRAVLRWLRLGCAAAGACEVLAGLNPGDRLILGPLEGLEDGMRVQDQPGGFHDPVR